MSRLWYLRKEVSNTSRGTSVYLTSAVLLPDAITQVTSSTDTPLNVRLFYSPTRISPDQLRSNLHTLRLDDIPTTEIPCSYISTQREDDLDYAICILSHSGR